MSQCGECGADNRVLSRRCVECGSPLQTNGLTAVAILPIAFLVVAFGLLALWVYEPDRPRPKVDRSDEIERMIAEELGTSFAEAELALVEFESGTDYPVAQSYRDWQYHGWYRLEGTRIHHPMTFPNDPDQVAQAVNGLQTYVEDAGGMERLVALCRTYEREFPNAEEFSATPYKWVFGASTCGDPQHMKVPRLVRNRFGEFDPQNVMLIYAGDLLAGSALPVAFVYDAASGGWTRLPGDAARVFESTRIHSGCDSSEVDAFLAEEPASNVTTIVTY